MTEKPYKSKGYRVSQNPVKARPKTASEEISEIDSGLISNHDRVETPAKETTWQRLKRRWFDWLDNH